MTGCEILKCPDFKDGKCTNELDYVSKIDGSRMCHRNEDAIPREKGMTEEEMEKEAQEWFDKGWGGTNPLDRIKIELWVKRSWVEACRKGQGETERLKEIINLVIDLLNGPHIKDNIFRLGAIGSGDIDRAIKLLEEVK